MKKLLLTSGAIAVLAGSQMGFAACDDSGNPNATSASCDSTVTLKIDDMVVLKGLDDYDFSDPGAAGWDGTGGTDAVVNGDFCVGTNNAASGVSVSVSSINDFEVQRGDGTAVSYNAYLNGSGTALANGATPLSLSGADVDNLECLTQSIDLNVEFTGTALMAANVGAEPYLDTITVTVAPN